VALYNINIDKKQLNATYNIIKDKEIERLKLEINIIILIYLQWSAKLKTF
jgi:hypothetical protein